MKIGLIDYDGKIPNLALMKLSTYHKARGDEVYFGSIPSNVDKVYCSVLFPWNRDKALHLRRIYPNIEFGGTGYDIEKKLPPEVDALTPDYDLYSTEEIYSRICRGIGTKAAKLKKAETIRNMGIGFTTRGCVRNCAFCVVPKKEGKLRQASEIRDIVRPGSNVITLLDNNLTADPYCLDKLAEIRDRGLTVDINQGIDVRLITEEKAKALSEVKHLSSLRYAWDLMEHEDAVMQGIEILSKYVKKWRQMCFILVGFNTTFEQDMYRFRKLTEIGVDPFVMIYNKQGTVQLRHFARWVNSRIYKSCDWEEYIPWVRAKQNLKKEELTNVK
ncbi:MAG TPA: hypothetical protein PKI14_10260 [Fervidobacterium sp.]|nr:hypothetical protein [Fervidobacterium sp.]